MVGPRPVGGQDNMAWRGGARLIAGGGVLTRRRGLSVPVCLLVLTSAIGLSVVGTSTSSGAPVTADGSQVHAVIQVETSPSYAGDTVHIDSSQLQASCGGTITFETIQGVGVGTANPRTSVDFIDVVLDDDGNVTVVVDGAPCAPGDDVIEADLTVAPFLTATTVVDVEPPQVTSEGLSASPANEVETGNSPASGESDVYTVFYVETSPVYAEQSVEISSPQLEARCGDGWRWEPGTGGVPIDQTSGLTTARAILDDDGNATFVFKGASCAAGPSAVIADVQAGSHPTYVTTYTVVAPEPTLAGAQMDASGSTKKAAAHTTARRRHRHSPTATTPPTDPPAMTVDANPNPLVESGSPTTLSSLTITKTDNQGGPGAVVTCTTQINYIITVVNTGSTTVNGAVVTDDFANNTADFDSDTYTSIHTAGVTGATGGGSGNIDDTLTIPPGEDVQYSVIAIINTTTSTLDNTAYLQPPTGPTLSATDDNSYSPDFSC